MIKTVPVDRRTMAVKHPLYEVLQTDSDADERMQSGSYKYGTSWCEVDLRTDMKEEALDLINYCVLAYMRMYEVVDDGPEAGHEVILWRIRAHALDILELLNLLPAFEGPTSNEWVNQ